ncbi:hypothetical protein AB0B58_25300, partial [Actinoplanes sp. NPDC049118]
MASDSQFYEDDDGDDDYKGVVVSGTSGSLRDDWKNWDGWQLKAAIHGSAGVGASNSDHAQLHNAMISPESLRSAGNTFNLVQVYVTSVSKNLRDQAKALVGKGKPWQGKAANAFLAKMDLLGEFLEHQAEKIKNGDAAGPASSMPSQLFHSGNVLKWAQDQSAYIDGYYASWATKLGVETVDGLVSIKGIPGLPEMFKEDMVKIIGVLAKEYALFSVNEVEPPAPNGGQTPPDLPKKDPTTTLPDPPDKDPTTTLPDPPKKDPTTTLPDPPNKDLSTNPPPTPPPTPPPPPQKDLSTNPPPTPPTGPPPPSIPPPGGTPPQPSTIAPPPPLGGALPPPSTITPNGAGNLPLPPPGRAMPPGSSPFTTPPPGTAPGGGTAGGSDGDSPSKKGFTPPNAGISPPPAADVPAFDGGQPPGLETPSGGSPAGLPKSPGVGLPPGAELTEPPGAVVPPGVGLPGSPGLGGLPPMMPMTPPGGDRGSGVDLPDSSGLVGGDSAPWGGGVPGVGVPDAPGGASSRDKDGLVTPPGVGLSPGVELPPGAGVPASPGLGGLPPMMPMTPPGGDRGSAADLPDSSGLVGGDSAPWGGGVPGVGVPDAPGGASARDRNGVVTPPGLELPPGVGLPGSPGLGGLPPMMPMTPPGGDRGSAADLPDSSGL